MITMRVLGAMMKTAEKETGEEAPKEEAEEEAQGGRD